MILVSSLKIYSLFIVIALAFFVDFVSFFPGKDKEKVSTKRVGKLMYIHELQICYKKLIILQMNVHCSFI